MKDENLRRAGLPTQLLGISYRSWRGSQLRIILDHYGRRYRPQASKPQLILAPQSLSQERSLTFRDRRNVLNVHTRRQRPQSTLARSEAPGLENEPLRRESAAVQEPLAHVEAQGLPNWIFHPSRPTYSYDTHPTSRTPPVKQEVDRPPSPASSIVADRNCLVCYDVLDEYNTPQQRTTSSCQHESNICRQCISTSINSQFATKMWDQIQCPSCNERLGYHDMQNFAEQETFER